MLAPPGKPGIVGGLVGTRAQLRGGRSWEMSVKKRSWKLRERRPHPGSSKEQRWDLSEQSRRKMILPGGSGMAWTQERGPLAQPR